MPERRRRNTARTITASAAVIGMLLAAPAAAAAPGAPAPTLVPGAVSSEARLVVTAGPLPQDARTMSPGDARYWPVSARLHGAERATLAVRIDRAGALAEHPSGIEVGVRACPDPWVVTEPEPVCAGGESALVDTAPLGATDRTPAFTLPSPGDDDAVHLLVTVALDDSFAARSDPSLQGLPSDIDVIVTASSIEGEPVPPSATALVRSGGDSSVSLALLTGAVILLVAGAATRRRASVSERRMGPSCRPLRVPPR